MEARDVANRYMPAEEIAGYQKERDVLGEDPYDYVMGENEKRTLAAMNRYPDRARLDENHAADGRSVHWPCVSREDICDRSNCIRPDRSFRPYIPPPAAPLPKRARAPKAKCLLQLSQQ
jgi:hypothetical protein